MGFLTLGSTHGFAKDQVPDGAREWQSLSPDKKKKAAYGALLYMAQNGFIIEEVAKVIPLIGKDYSSNVSVENLTNCITQKYKRSFISQKFRSYYRQCALNEMALGKGYYKDAYHLF